MTLKRVLVVDDDPDVLYLVDIVLAESGLEAVAADGGAAALKALERSAFDLLLTDIRMPGMDGFELAKRARRAHPTLRVLFMSGYSSQYPLDPVREDVVAKPFRPQQLLARVHAALGRPPS